jgi:hypothetical protein
MSESEFQKISEKEAFEAGVDESFKNRSLKRDENGRIISSNEILESEGYEFLTDDSDSWIRKIKFQDKEYELDYPLYHTYLFEEHIVFFTGMVGIESGFIRYFFTPEHSQLITVMRDDFEFVNKKIIFGIVRNVELLNGQLYFVAEKGDQFLYGIYEVNE